MHESPQSPVLRGFIAAFGIVAVLKFYFATELDLYSDEIFYWLASTDLGLAYSDLPFMTALMAGIGSAIAPGSAFAVRLLFLILGSAIPLLIYWLALPITNRHAALNSALLALCLPLGGFLGLLAVPDVPLIFFGILSIGFFERAVRTDSLRYWIVTGVFVACGLSTHYRFFLYPLAAVLFLVFFKPERKQWRNPRFYLAIAISSLGLIPIIWFNLSNQLSSASFYLVERHPWEFQASGLLHAFKQAGLVTPPLYFCFVITLLALYQRAVKGDRPAALLLSFSLTNLLVYLILAPWTDANSTSIHWPLSGYFPLLVALPDTLKQIEQWCEERWSLAAAYRITRTIPAIGFIGTLAALIGVASQAYQQQLQPILGTGVLSNKMAGWKEFSAHTASLIDNQSLGARPILITDNYYTAAQLKFAGVTDTAITLDRDKAVRDGRVTQLGLWQMDASAVADYSGQPALYINEDSTLIEAEKIALLTEICRQSTTITAAPPLSLYAGDKAFSFYFIAALTQREPQSSERARPCPFPSVAWIDSPQADARLSGSLQVSGWAYNEDIGVASVELLIDGEIVKALDYGITRDDVVSVQGVTTDPNRPRLGFGGDLDSSLFDNGRHSLAVRIVNKAGSQRLYGEREVFIQN